MRVNHGNTAKHESRQFVTAARRIFSGKESYACHAISDARLKERFVDIFMPDGWTKEQHDAALFGWFGAPFLRSAFEERLVALCFMAAMVETGDA